MRIHQILRLMLVVVVSALSISATSHAFSIIDTGTVSGGNPGGQAIFEVTGLVAGDTFNLSWLGFTGIGIDGTLTVNSLNANQAEVTVSLNNNSTLLGNDDPRITIFGLSVGGGLTGFAGTGGSFLTSFDNSNFPGFKGVDVCATSGNNCAGGGGGGIKTGFSDTFAFVLNGNFVGSLLTLNDFAIKIQDGPNGPNGDSFELAGIPGEQQGTPVPEPGSVILIGSGLVALGFLTRRKREN